MTHKRATPWNKTANWEAVCRRAGGRRRYNAERHTNVLVRRYRMFEMLPEIGMNLFAYGTQTVLADRLGVHRSTICRDVRRILRDLNAAKPCPVCGAMRR